MGLIFGIVLHKASIVPIAVNKISSRLFADKQILLVAYSVHYLAAALRFIEPYSSNGNMTFIAERIVYRYEGRVEQYS